MLYKRQNVFTSGCVLCHGALKLGIVYTIMSLKISLIYITSKLAYYSFIVCTFLKLMYDKKMQDYVTHVSAICLA